jgi:hypothetical protein
MQGILHYRNIYLKIFGETAMADMEVVFPEKKVGKWADVDALGQMAETGFDMHVCSFGSFVYINNGGVMSSFKHRPYETHSSSAGAVSFAMH